MSEVDTLKEQIKVLTQELEAIKNQKKSAGSAAEEMVEKIGEKLSFTKDEAREVADKLSEEVKKSPLKTLAIAAGIGFLAARILK